MYKERFGLYNLQLKKRLKVFLQLTMCFVIRTRISPNAKDELRFQPSPTNIKPTHISLPWVRLLGICLFWCKAVLLRFCYCNCFLSTVSFCLLLHLFIYF